MVNKNILQVIREIWSSIGVRRRHQLIGLLFLMIVVSFFEVISISAVLPFLTLLLSPDYLDKYSYLKDFHLVKSNPLLFFTFLFGLLTLLVSAMRLLMMWAALKLSFTIGGELSMKMYRLTLYQPYEIHLAANSSELLDGIVRKSGDLISCINHSASIISAIITTSFILSALIYIDSRVATSVFVGFGIVYLLVFYLSRKKLETNSAKVASASTSVVKLIQEALGGIRDIIIDGSQELYCRSFKVADSELRKAQWVNNFIAGCPRYIVEAMGIVFILVLAYFLVNQSGHYDAVPVLGAFAFGAQRLLPLMQQVYNSWTSIKGNQHALIDGLNILQQPESRAFELEDYNEINFRHEIVFKNISYKYSESSDWILKDINFKIPKGARIGVIGKSGSGKSTLMDMVMGLLVPTKGELIVDEIVVDNRNVKSWQKNIAHVPQSIYLADATVFENIAFGVEKDSIDFFRVIEAARLAGIDDAISSFPLGYETMVGERGVRLSGGERQRIGIARALYKRATILILDEATSALDYETEKSIVDHVYGLDKSLTVLMVAHRISTLKSCDYIISVKKNTLTIAPNSNIYLI